MRYWYDTEFIEDGRTIELISIGIVAEDGRELYFESSDVDLFRSSEWVKDNVVCHLWHKQKDKSAFNEWSLTNTNTGGLSSRNAIAHAIRKFCDPDKYGKPEFWAYYADYDHVVLCQLFGTMMDLPDGWPMYTRDIKQLCDSLGNPKLPEQESAEHHALADARWTRLAHEFLLNLDK
ncbi:MAG: 3'-5' exoribonuclease domain-containing protein [Limisphaerales bacterium]